MKYKLIKKDKKLNEIGLVLGGLGHVLQTGWDIGSAIVPPLVKGGIKLTKWGVPKLGQVGLGTLKLGAQGLVAAKNVADSYEDWMNDHIKDPYIDKRTGELKYFKRKDAQSNKLALVPKELRSECIKLISRITNKSFKESQELFKIMYKKFVLESSKYLKENTNPINTLILFKGYLESEWKKIKKKH